MPTTSVPSNRLFEIVFVLFFVLKGIVYWWHGNRAYPYLFGLSLLVSATTVFKPSFLGA